MANIQPLSGNSSFYDWYLKTNDEIIAQLNQMTIYGATSSTDIRMSVNSNILSAQIGSTLGIISSGLTFNGKVSFTGEVAVPNISFKINGITSGTKGYTFGSIIRLNGINGYTLACGDNPDNAEVLGVLSSLQNSYSVVTSLGQINGNFTSVSGGTLSAGCIYFLDPTLPGKITTTEPISVGQVSKPIIMGISGDTGLVVQYRGNYLQGNSNIGLSGSNRIYVILPSASSSNGFLPGNFVSYLPYVGSYGVSFDNYLIATGRTAYSGWFMSQSTSSSVDSPLPFEEDYVVGMIETSTTYGTDKVYQIVTHGASETIPNSISSNPGLYGRWYLKETYYNPTDQLNISNNNSFEPGTSERLHVGYNYTPSSFVVDLKPIMRSISSNRSTTLPASNDSVGVIANELFNGDLSIWQRSTARDTAYTANTTKIYFADQWVRRTSRISSITQSLQRKTFDKHQTSVEGSPAYYIDIKCLLDPGYTWDNDSCSVGHIIPGIESLNNEDITISFYAKCTNNNYSLDVYASRYNGASMMDKKVIDTIPITTSWDKYVVNYKMPGICGGNYSNDYVEIGVDLKPLIKLAHTNSVSTSSNLFVSLASTCVYKGKYNNPKHLFDANEIKKIKANKYYYTTYTETQKEGTATLTASGEIAFNANNIGYTPTSSFKYEKFPTEMRITPTISFYSPKTGSSNDAFNLNAVSDLRQTSGTIGYERKTRSAPLNTSTITSVADTTGYKVNIQNGAVPFDLISYHIIADASYPL